MVPTVAILCCLLLQQRLRQNIVETLAETTEASIQAVQEQRGTVHSRGVPDNTTIGNQ